MWLVHINFSSSYYILNAVYVGLENSTFSLGFTSFSRTNLKVPPKQIKRFFFILSQSSYICRLISGQKNAPQKLCSRFLSEK